VRKQYSKFFTIGFLGVSLFARTSLASSAKEFCDYTSEAARKRATEGERNQDGITIFGNVSQNEQYFFEVYTSYSSGSPESDVMCYKGEVSVECKSIESTACGPRVAAELKQIKDKKSYETKQAKDTKDQADHLADTTKAANNQKRDDCYESNTYGGSTYNCRKTKNKVKTAQIMNQGAELAGSAAVNILSADALSKLNGNASMADNYDAQGKSAKTAAGISSVVSAANIVYSAMQAKAARKHSDNAIILRQARDNAEFGKKVEADGTRGFFGQKKGATWTPNEQSDSGLKQHQLNGAGRRGAIGNQAQLREQIKAKLKCTQEEDCERKVNQTLNAMISQQETVAQEAQQGAFASTMSALKQAVTSYTSNQAFIASKTEANNLRAIENTQSNIAQTQNALDALTLNNGVYGDAAATAEDGELNSGDQIADNTLPNGDLGAPNEPAGGTEMGTPPIAGAFRESKTPGGSVAGGGGLGGGGGGAPSAGNQDEGKAAYAAGFEGKDRYESAGTMVSRGGAGGGAKADSGGGMDFNSLLAQFLPKSGAEEPAGQGILEYAGGRSPASAQPEDSYLDRNADIFQRIHQTYQEKQARRQLGI